MIYVELSLAQSSMGKGKDALASAEKAIEKLGNAHDLAVFAKGRAYQADNQLDKARETYAEAVGFRQQGQDWPELYYALGQLRMAEKNFDDAVASEDAELTRLFRRLGVDQIEVRTDAPIVRPLLSFFRRRERQLRR